VVSQPPPDRAVYGIAVASELTGVQPQALRDLETRGLIQPARTEGGTRRYSHQDVERVAEIAALLATGLNYEGVEQVLRLHAETGRLRAEIDHLKRRRGK
jgi:MerR family transcriptional regulator, heat shock protein HspR